MSKSPILAFILSIIPGLGHIYAAGIAKGLVYLLIIWCTLGISLCFCIFGIGFLMAPLVYLGGAFHAAFLATIGD